VSHVMRPDTAPVRHAKADGLSPLPPGIWTEVDRWLGLAVDPSSVGQSRRWRRSWSAHQAAHACDTYGAPPAVGRRVGA
jgi:hypothetical protein